MPGSMSTRPGRKPGSSSSWRRSPRATSAGVSSIFHSEKAACYSCHAIGYRGGNVGPDLTQNRRGPGRTRPSRGDRFSQRQLRAQLRADRGGHQRRQGRQWPAPRRDGRSELILATGVNQEARISRRDIDEMRPGTVSVMPAGLDQQLTPQELADLVAFLKACK